MHADCISTLYLRLADTLIVLDEHLYDSIESREEDAPSSGRRTSYVFSSDDGDLMLISFTATTASAMNHASRLSNKDLPFHIAPARSNADWATNATMLAPKSRLSIAKLRI